MDSMDDDDDNSNDGNDPNAKTLTSKTISEWCQLVSKDPKSPALRNLLNAFMLVDMVFTLMAYRCIDFKMPECFIK
jgi:hypothetical protein